MFALNSQTCASNIPFQCDCHIAYKRKTEVKTLRRLSAETCHHMQLNAPKANTTKRWTRFHQGQLSSTPVKYLTINWIQLTQLTWRNKRKRCTRPRPWPFSNSFKQCVCVCWRWRWRWRWERKRTSLGAQLCNGLDGKGMWRGGWVDKARTVLGLHLKDVALLCAFHDFAWCTGALFLLDPSLCDWPRILFPAPIIVFFIEKRSPWKKTQQPLAQSKKSGQSSICRCGAIDPFPSFPTSWRPSFPKQLAHPLDVSGMLIRTHIQ